MKSGHGGRGGQKRPKMGGRPLYTVPYVNFQITKETSFWEEIEITKKRKKNNWACTGETELINGNWLYGYCIATKHCNNNLHT